MQKAHVSQRLLSKIVGFLKLWGDWGGAQSLLRTMRTRDLKLGT